MLLDLETILKENPQIKLRGCIHVGGHFGQEFPIYKRIGIENCIFFEPHPKTFSILENNVKGENVILVNKAVGTTEGKATLFSETANEGQSNSLLRSGLHSVFYPHIVFDQEVEVEVISLDNYMKDMDKSKYNFLMIDTQGADLDVMKSGPETLKYIDLIMTEFNTAELYEGCGQLGEMEEFLKGHGFKRANTYLTEFFWGDCVFIRE